MTDGLEMEPMGMIHIHADDGLTDGNDDKVQTILKDIVVAAVDSQVPNEHFYELDKQMETMKKDPAKLKEKKTFLVHNASDQILLRLKEEIAEGFRDPVGGQLFRVGFVFGLGFQSALYTRGFQVSIQYKFLNFLFDIEPVIKR
jgi:hypothetical protein